MARRKTIFLILLLTISSTAALLVHAPGITPTRGDETDYYKISNSIRQGTGYGILKDGELLPTRFPPIYPLALSPFIPLEKYSPILLAIPSIAAFLGTLFLILRFYGESGWGKWIAVLYAAHFYVLYMAFRLRSEHFFILLLFAVLLLYRRFRTSNKPLYLAGALLLAVISAYTRTVGWILAGSILILLLKERRRDLFLPSLLLTSAALLHYVNMTDTGRYVYDIGRIPKPHGQVYQAFSDAFVHFGRNVIDYFSGFWTSGITREASWTWLFIFKTLASSAISVTILLGFLEKIRSRGLDLEEVFFMLYPATFCALAIYSDMYRYFLPVFPACIFYFLIALDKTYKLKHPQIAAILWTLLPLYVAKTTSVIFLGSRFHN